MNYDEMIQEINALAKKKREQGLTAAEQKRQKELYAIYLKGFRAQVKAKLDNTDVEYPDGTVKTLRQAMTDAHDFGQEGNKN